MSSKTTQILLLLGSGFAQEIERNETITRKDVRFKLVVSILKY